MNRRSTLSVATPESPSSRSSPAAPAPSPPAAARTTAPPRTPSAPAASGRSWCPTRRTKNYNLQFIQGVAGDEFYITMQCGIEAEAAKLGVTVKTQGPQKFDPTLQKPILDSVTAAKPDAILIAPTDVTAMQTPLKAAAAAGIKVDPGRHHHRGPVVRHVGDRLGQRRRRQGGVRRHQAAQPQRRQGHGDVDRPRRLHHDQRIQGLRGRGRGRLEVQVPGVQYSHNDPATAANLMTSALQKDPDIVGVFAANLFAAEGVATGVRQAGKAASRQDRRLRRRPEPGQGPAGGHRPGARRPAARPHRHSTASTRPSPRWTAARSPPEDPDRLHRHHQGGGPNIDGAGTVSGVPAVDDPRAVQPGLRRSSEFLTR
jgi:ribose transport system substrate-binding protein